MSIEVSSVSRSFGQVKALENATFQLRENEIKAFVGPNGAGKSTALRIMAGLTHPDSGSVLFEGKPRTYHVNPSEIVGFCLDPTAHHPGRTIKETLRLVAVVTGTPTQRVDETLTEIGLSQVAKKRVGKLSLGMRQRLAIGCALLPKPKYLVLDEPINGLDLEGVIWVRNLLKEHAANGGGVLLSSHLLKEAQVIADSVLILSKGKIVVDKPVAELNNKTRSIAKAIDTGQLAQALTEQHMNYTIENQVFTVDATSEQLGKLCANKQIALTSLGESDSTDMETLFLDVTQGEFSPQSTYPPKVGTPNE